jgi:DnaK suppressor protein
MDTIKLRRYQEQLSSRRQEILSTLLRLEGESREINGERYFDWLDQARGESESRLLDRLTDGYLQEMGKIEKALRRILAGSYGRCAACSRPIGERRLDIFPAAEFCSECEGMREEFERV